jgi:hypothetical protein
MIRDRALASQGISKSERLQHFVRTISGFSSEKPDLVSVFREGQYRFFEYEQRLEAIYTRALSSVLEHEIAYPDYLFAMGGIRFCSIRHALQKTPMNFASVLTILQTGLFKGLAFDKDRVFGGSALPLPVKLEEGARERLLRSGKRLFGEKGYFETNIHEITDDANLSVGSFYTYFDSKESFLSELIRLIGHEVRSFIARNVQNSENPLGETAGLNRLELELRGMWL